MSIVAGDLSFKAPLTVNNDVNTNGGSLNNNVEITPSYFPDITGAERTAGAWRYRKVFFKNEQADGSDLVDLELGNPKVYIKSWSPAGDFMRIAAGVNNPDATLGDLKRDVQDDADSMAVGAWGGCGILEEQLVVGEQDITVQVENYESGVDEAFFNVAGATIVVIKLGTPEYKEFHTVQSAVYAGTVSVGNKSWHRWTITVDSPGILASSIDFRGGSGVNVAQAGSGGDTLIGTDTWTVNEHAEKLVRITSLAGAGNEGELRRILSNTSNTLTLEYDYPASDLSGESFEIIDAVVSQCIDLKLSSTASGYLDQGIIASFNSGANGSPVYEKDDVYVSSAAGTFDPSQIEIYPVGCIDDTISIVCTVAGAIGDPTPPEWTVEGDVSLGIDYYAQAGSVNLVGDGVTDYEPVNPYGQFYFKILAAALGGTWALNDRIEFNTVSSSRCFWIKQRVPANTRPHADNKWYLGSSGDTV